jgi:DNA (cytosine-5)-methyltransferase 1
MLTHGSLFSGAGGCDQGFDAAGFETKFQVEIEPWAQEVLHRHWPDVPKWTDVKDVKGSDLPPVDVLTFGFPCQDVSVAGRRAGLAGARTGLFYEAVRIIKEMREATGGRYPTWAVAENVPGLLSADDGTAMGCVLDELAQLGSVDICWRVLDARYFGVPQRRRRVFIVACFDPRAASRPPVFPDGPGGERSAEESGEAGEEVAGTLGGGSGSRGWAPDTDRMTFVADAAPIGFHMIQDPISSEGRDPALRAKSSGMGVAYPLAMRGREDGAELEMGEADTYNALRAGNGGSSRQNLVAYNPYRTKTGPGEWVEGWKPDGVVDAVTAVTPPKGRPVVVQPAVAVSENQRGELRLTGYAQQLTTGGGKPGQGYPAVMQNLAVRRLTPRECERLMGWPDDHTRWTADGREIADSHRYRMCGNGVVAPVAKWIAEQILNAHQA